MKMIGKEFLTIGVLVAILLSAGAGSVYAHKGTDDNKPLIVKLTAEDKDKLNSTEYSLKLHVVGSDSLSLKGNGHYKVKNDNAEVRNFEITGSQVSNNGHLIILWGTEVGVEGVEQVVNIVVSVTDDAQPFVTYRNENGGHIFPDGTFQIEVKNL